MAFGLVVDSRLSAILVRFSWGGSNGESVAGIPWGGRLRR